MTMTDPPAPPVPTDEANGGHAHGADDAADGDAPKQSSLAASADADAAEQGGGSGSGLHYAASPDDRDSERSHTFRQRRLTYTRHHLEGAAAAAAAAAAVAVAGLEGLDSDDEDDASDEEEEEEADAKVEETVEETEDAKEGDEEHPSSTTAGAGDKRKRSPPKPSTTQPSTSVLPTSSPTTLRSPPPKRRRRLEPRVVHSTAPPAHMRRETTHRLYDHSNDECAAHRLAVEEQLQQVVAGETAGELPVVPVVGEHEEEEHEEKVPAKLSAESTSVQKKELPDWRKRRFVRHSIKEDEAKLPFPRDIVGTYSCHGVEPLYDSDYEDEDYVDKHTNDSSSDDEVEGAAKPTPGDATVAKINQDRGGVAFPYGNCPRTALFAAYDGHGDGGEYVAQYALHEVQRRLEHHPSFDRDIEKAMRETFVQVDEDLATVPEIEPLYAGATACVVLLREETLTVANAGDSRAVLSKKRTGGGKNMRQSLDLSVDQNPDSPGEQERIEGAGGFVSPPPEPGLSARVWLDPEYTQIGLAMARSIGDHAVKPVGVIADPVVTSHDLSEDDEFLIVATDGVWEFITSEDAVDLVGRHLDAGEGASRACQCLIEEAAAKWHEHEGDYRDDITAVVVTFKEIWSNSHSLRRLSDFSTYSASTNNSLPGSPRPRLSISSMGKSPGGGGANQS